MSEITYDNRIYDVLEQDRIVEYVSVVFAGQRAQEFKGPPRFGDLRGTPAESRAYGGIIVASVLHYYQQPDIDTAPTTYQKTDQDLWRHGHAVFEAVDFHRDEGGRITPEMRSKISEYAPNGDPRIDIGSTLVVGLQRRGTRALSIAMDAEIALVNEFGHQPLYAA